MTATLVDPDAGPGRLTISDRTVERIAAAAIGEVDGVGGSAARVLGVAVGRDEAVQVTAVVGARTTSLAVRLSVAYPAPVARTTEAARAHVVRRVEELTGLAVTRVDITVTALHGDTPHTRRVQ